MGRLERVRLVGIRCQQPMYGFDQAGDTCRGGFGVRGQAVLAEGSRGDGADGDPRDARGETEAGGL